MKLHLASLLVLIFFWGCEMPMNDLYFVDIPQEEMIPVGIDLNIATDGQQLLVNQTTLLSYSLSGMGRNIAAACFRMGEKEWKCDAKNGSFYIYQQDFPAGTYQLECELYMKSNSGSLADQFDAEYYGGTVSWPVLVDYELEYANVIRFETTPERFLKLEWEDPFLSHLNICGYRILYTGPNGFKTRTINTTGNHFVDSLYVGEKASYALYALLEDPDTKEKLTWILGAVSLPLQIKTHITHLPDDRVRFSWETPFQSTISIADRTSMTQYYPQKDSCFIDFPAAQISEQNWTSAYQLDFRVSPLNDARNYIYQSINNVQMFPTVRLGDYWSAFGFLMADNHLVKQQGRKLQSYNMTDLSLKAGVQLESDYSIELITSAYHSRIALRLDNVGSSSNSVILIFDNSRLNDPIRIQADGIPYNGLVGQELIYFTDDVRLVYLTSVTDAVQGVVCDARTGSKQKTFSLQNFNRITYPRLSSDGKYMCFTTSSGNVTVVALDDFQEKSRQNLYEGYFSYQYYFHPNRKHELICTDNYSVDVWDLTTMEIIRSFDLPRYASIQGIDPITGYLISDRNSRIMIISPEDGQVLLETGNQSSQISLINNYLTSGEGYVLNIEKFITK